MTPTKDNTLYLTIKQVYFDQIVAGTKKDEFRDITPNTYKKYLDCDEDGEPYYNNEVLNEQDLESTRRGYRRGDWHITANPNDTRRDTRKVRLRGQR